jgi:hypothetical protein
MFMPLSEEFFRQTTCASPVCSKPVVSYSLLQVENILLNLNRMGLEQIF